MTLGTVGSSQAALFVDEAMLFVGDLLGDVCCSRVLVTHALGSAPGRAVLHTLCDWLRESPREALASEAMQRMAVALMHLLTQLHDVALELQGDEAALYIMAPTAGAAAAAAHHLLLIMHPDDTYHSLMGAYSALQSRPRPRPRHRVAATRRTTACRRLGLWRPGPTPPLAGSPRWPLPPPLPKSRAPPWHPARRRSTKWPMWP